MSAEGCEFCERMAVRLKEANERCAQVENRLQEQYAHSAALQRVIKVRNDGLRWFLDFFTIDASMAVLGETLQKTLLEKTRYALEAQGGTEEER